MIMTDKKRFKYLEHIIRNLPHKPGVYKMKNSEGHIIYVGKAKDLKSRVSSYFQNTSDKGMRTMKMVEQIADIEYTVVGSELEALILETNLIKELRPKYNVLMKDDKNYVYIKITVQEPYPRIYLVRKVSKDKSRYIGPKTSAHKVIKTLKVLKRVFPFKNCSMAIDYGIHGENKKSMQMTEANLRYHIKHCIGPCITSVKPEEYRKIISQVIEFLEGKHEEIIRKIQEEMMKAASEKKFEIAAAIRDKLKAVEEIIEPQRISDPHLKDFDIINYAEQDEKVYFNLFQLRNGKLIGQENFIFKTAPDNEKEDRDALTAFLEQYYEKTMDLPKEVLIPHEIDDLDTMESWLSHMKGQKVRLIVPERGKKNHLLELSYENAKSFARQSQVKWQGTERDNRDKALQELQDLLNLPSLPKRLECYDISHFGGTETVGSMVVFENGFPKKEDYRKFKLHQEQSGAPNDYASMEETLLRRLKYLKPSIVETGLTVQKARKKEKAAMAQKLEIKELAGNQIYVIKKEKKLAGFVHIVTFQSKKTLISNMETEAIPDLHIFIKKILEKTKTRRLYFACPKSQQGTYEEAGFQYLQKIPDEFPRQPDKAYLVYDRTKYVEDKSFKKTPDLMVIDGGKGQLYSALKALSKYGLSMNIIAIAKKEEEIFLPGKPDSIRLEKNDPILHLIQHIRDEAHRFAVCYHKNLRLKATTGSILDTIFGMGPGLKMKLLKKFGSLEGIKNATMHDLAQIVGHKLAMKVKQQL